MKRKKPSLKQDEARNRACSLHGICTEESKSYKLHDVMLYGLNILKHNKENK